MSRLIFNPNFWLLKLKQQSCFCTSLCPSIDQYEILNFCLFVWYIYKFSGFCLKLSLFILKILLSSFGFCIEQIIILILDGNPEHVARLWRKICPFWKKNQICDCSWSKKKCSKRSNNRCRSTRAHLFLIYHQIYVPWVRLKRVGVFKCYEWSYRSNNTRQGVHLTLTFPP